MNRRIKRCIRDAFPAPAPEQEKKLCFLRTLPQPRLSMRRFIVNQAAYLRKWVLLLSVLLLFPAMIGAYYLKKDMLWIMSALIPVLALMAVAEGARSEVYGMHELELATRFSLKSVILARWSMMGMVNLLVLGVLIPLCRIDERISLLHTAVCLLIPYLLTVNICLHITRRIHGKEAIYGCMGAAGLVSAANIGLRFLAANALWSMDNGRWLILSVILLGGMVYELHHTIRQSEEYTWSLSLTD